MAEAILVSKAAIVDLIRLKDEFDSIIESLELMADQEFMTSYNASKEQVAAREFENWNEL